VPTRRSLSLVGALALASASGLTPSYAASGFLGSPQPRSVEGSATPQQQQQQHPPQQQPPQQQPPQQPPQPTFRTEANYVRVDVYPTQDGAPVLDLTRDDFEVLEAGVPQKLEQFEHVVIRAAGPQDTRIEPNSVAEARSMAESPRARLFVVFLDTGHVGIAGSHNIRRPLVDMLNRVIGRDDLVGVMTPEMSAGDITFARKTETIEGMLARHWDWGDREKLALLDPVEQQYAYCYGEPKNSPLTAEMIARRREKHTLDALSDLVRFLRGVREERKAIVTISDGWALRGPNLTLMAPIQGRVPTGPPVGVDPRTGKLSTRDSSNPGVTASSDCDRDRMLLAQIDNRQEFLTLLDEANRANASFYPIDPRGLPVFDSPIDNPLPLDVDLAVLRQRETTLRTIADATDGLAVLNSNDLDRGLRRIAADLSSYYLLGYYSSGKLDGRFHAITVRVKRPRVQVRARRGYLAATPDAVSSAAAKAAPKPIDADAMAVQTALAPLAELQRELPLRVQATAGWRPGSNAAPTAAFWVVGEFGAGAPPGRDVDLTVVAASGATVARATSPGGTRGILVALSPAEAAAAGEYTVRVRSEGFGTGSVRITLPAAPDSSGAIFTRRGPTTGNKEIPTADLRFRRNEQIRVDVPTTDPGAATARLLDRMGKALAIPLTVTVRDDGDGSRWQTTQLPLAPLGPGDYVIEIRAGGAAGEKRTLAAFRIVQ